MSETCWACPKIRKARDFCSCPDFPMGFSKELAKSRKLCECK